MTQRPQITSGRHRHRPPFPADSTNRHANAIARGPLLALGARALYIPISTLVTVAATRFIIGRLGVNGFAAYAVITGSTALLSFSSLGVGAAVTDALSRRGSADPRDVSRIMLTSLRTALGAGAVLMVSAVSIGIAGAWPALLGVSYGNGTNVAAATAVAIFGLTIPIGLSQNILIGIHKNHVAIAFQIAGTLCSLGVVVAAYLDRGPLAVYAAAPYFGLLMSGSFSFLYIVRASEIELLPTVRATLSSARGASIRGMAGAMAVILVAGTVANQSDRLILGHLSTDLQVARYSVGSLLLGASLGLIQASATSLWPLFASTDARRRGTPCKTFYAILVSFGAGGVLMAVGAIAFGPTVTGWVSDGRSSAPVGLMASFGTLIVLQAVWWPLGMLLRDEKGLRLQAVWTVATSLLNVLVSVILTRRFGAAGPVLGTSVAILVMCCACWSDRRRFLA